MTDAAKIWAGRLAPYKQPDNRRAIFEIVVTVVPFVLLWLAIFAMFKAGKLSLIVGGVLALIPAAGLMIRLFIIQHDCGHGSMFSSRRANDWIGRFLGIITLTPYEYWRRLHATHHAGSGNLERRGAGDIDTLTVREYQAKSWFGKLVYRLYRHPVILFGIGPAYLFLLRHRLPIGSMRQGRKPWISALATNLGIAVVAGLVIYLTGLSMFLAIQVPIVVIGASIGVWLFYIQHQFDETHWDHDEDWNHSEAALQGSSFYDLPRPLMWITGNIGIHHVHHLSSKIPFHRLPHVVRDHPELQTIGRLTLLDSLKCVRLALWDEKTRQLISFRDLPLHATPAAG